MALSTKQLAFLARRAYQGLRSGAGRFRRPSGSQMALPGMESIGSWQDTLYRLGKRVRSVAGGLAEGKATEGAHATLRRTMAKRWAKRAAFVGVPVAIGAGLGSSDKQILEGNVQFGPKRHLWFGEKSVIRTTAKRDETTHKHAPGGYGRAVIGAEYIGPKYSHSLLAATHAGGGIKELPAVFSAGAKIATSRKGSYDISTELGQRSRELPEPLTKRGKKLYRRYYRPVAHKDLYATNSRF